MNKDKWSSMPPDIQKTIDGMSLEYIDKYASMWNDVEKSGKQFLLNRGNKIITLSKEEDARWVKAAQPIFNTYVKKMKEKGLPGEEALKFAQDYLATEKKGAAAPAKAPTKAKAPAKK
jgi:TRAP-type C4-dicarboxylate transport system substrate-binding protein